MKFENKELFDFMKDRVNETGQKFGMKPPQAFARWFAELYFAEPIDFNVTDASGDGKVDAFFKADIGDSLDTFVLNTKFTGNYNKAAPVSFYDEITRFWQAFENKTARSKYMKTVRQELRAPFKRLFDSFDGERVNLMFVTDHRRNQNQHESVKDYKIDIFHLEDVLQFMADHIEDAMPKTPAMLLTGIAHVLSPERTDTIVPTSIVFARLIDIIKYMDKDKFGLLFARNVRLSLGNTEVNKEIRKTFVQAPNEFAFSNNGITMLCEKHSHDPGTKELRIENPRIVNGSQTLHSINDVENPSKNARVMVRIIEVQPPSANDLARDIQWRKEIINKISVRSNQQNPIKKWNLVANDDFQQELSRFFRKQGFFYERRKNEWKMRKAQLRGIGIRSGPEIKWLAQLISSFHYLEKELGPANAKQSVAELFENKRYELIRKTPVQLAFQCFQLAEILLYVQRERARHRRFMANLQGHADLAFFSLAVKLSSRFGARWGKEELSKNLAAQFDDPDKKWNRFVEELGRFVYREYRVSANAFFKKEGRELTLNNYFKLPTHVARLFRAPIPQRVNSAAERILWNASS